MIKNTLAILALFLAVLLFSGTVSSRENFKPLLDVMQTGEIRGVVDFCGESGSGGALIYIPGKSFIAKTGPSGEFVLYYVPEGIYNLIIEVQNQAHFTINNVQVKRRKITHLGTISHCPDSDGDGYDVSADCNDNNPYIFPGAQELCDGVDNNCDGVVDEGCPTCTDADIDGFYAQEGCGTLVDCDDSRATVNPNANEVCDDGIDNDCDGASDLDDSDCTCIPFACSGLSYICGQHEDGCGGTLDCGTCEPGFACDNGLCVDIDECADPDICGPNAICVNTVGSYMCIDNP